MLTRVLTRSFLVFCAASGLAQASSISVVLPNANAEQLGYATNYLVTISPTNFNTSVQWSWSQTDSVSSPQQPSTLGGGGVNTSVNFFIPGTFSVQAVITYSQSSASGMQATPPPVTLTRTVTIPPPSIASIQGAGGTNTSSYCTTIPGPTASPATATSLGGQPGFWIYFILKSGGNTIGPMIDEFIVQENLTNFNVYLMDKPDSGWIPNPNNPSTSFSFGQVPGGIDYAILDFKTLSLPGNGVPQFGSVCTYTQANQISWTDLYGNTVTQPLNPPNNWTYTGTNTLQGAMWLIGYQ